MAEKPDFSRDRIDSKMINLIKTGSVTRNNKLKELNVIADRLNSLYDDEVLYDIFFNGDRETRSLTYTELVTNALFIHPCCIELRNEQIQNAILDANDSIDYCDKILTHSTNLDKYRLIRQPFQEQIPGVIMLPGSNTYDQFVDENVVGDLVAGGAKIKPHPITNREFIFRIQKKFGVDNVLPQKASGYDILKNSDAVYTTGGSETAIYACMLGKRLGSIEKSPKIQRPAYRPIFDALIESNNPLETLNFIFNSPKSGIIFKWDDESKLVEFLETLER